MFICNFFPPTCNQFWMLYFKRHNWCINWNVSTVCDTFQQKGIAMKFYYILKLISKGAIMIGLLVWIIARAVESDTLPCASDYTGEMRQCAERARELFNSDDHSLWSSLKNVKLILFMVLSRLTLGQNPIAKALVSLKRWLSGRSHVKWCKRNALFNAPQL